MIERVGGLELTLLPGGWRVYFYEILVRCLLALGRDDEAQRAVERAVADAEASGLPLPAVMADRAAGELRPYPDATGDWPDAMLLIARRQLDLYRAHPWLVEILARPAALGPP